MNRKTILRAIGFVFVLALLVLLPAGCTDTTVPDHVAAIELAIAENADFTEDFYYFEYEDLLPQVESALETMEKKQETYEYSITVFIPTVEAIPDMELESVLPEIPFTLTTGSDVYGETFLLAMTEIIEDYIIDEELDASVAVELDVILNKEEEGWSAQLRQTDINRLCRRYKEEIQDKAKSLLAVSEAYRILLLAEENEVLVGDMFSNSSFRDYLKLQSVEPDADGFILTYAYPDPAEAYDKAYQKGYTDYEQTSRLFENLSNGSAQSKLSSHIKDFMEDSTVKTVTASVADAEALPDELTKISEEIAAVRNEKANQLMEKVNAEFVIQTQELPATKVLWGDNSGQPIYVETSAELDDLHITFYRLSGTDLSEEGEKALSAYLRGGDSLTVYLPAGNYKMVQGSGDNWYGDTHAFGPSGYYSVSDILMAIQGGYEYTLKLYGVIDGNFPTSSIPFPY